MINNSETSKLLVTRYSPILSVTREVKQLLMTYKNNYTYMLSHDTMT